MEIPAEIDKHLNCLIEDYKAIKSEISRRSELQRFALLAYGGIIALSLKFNENPNLYPTQILLIWLSSSIAYLFYISEDKFIKRLSKNATFDSWLFNYLCSKKSYGCLEPKLLRSEFEAYYCCY